MATPAWPHDTPPFHAGEQAVQARAGSRERMAELGPRVMLSAMPEQHRDFFALLPFVAIGAQGAGGQPWATLLAGAQPGFLHSPDPTRLRVDALPPACDPLAAALRPGTALGLLGIELPTRRRNRANGRIAAVDERGFLLEVAQSFGNCPKYIQRRELVAVRACSADAAPVRHASSVDAQAAALIGSADTFFIASHAAGEGANGGSDVSHRGGHPGFVQVSDDGRVLSWPDFTGNRFFNTLGNIAASPRVGLVFADFETGALLQVAGRAEIVWDGPQLRAYAGAERLLRLHVDEVLHRPGGLPQRWRLVEASPALAGTGHW